MYQLKLFPLQNTHAFCYSAVPGAPEHVRVTSVSPYAVEVEWNTPTAPNGVIIYYNVYSNGTLVASVNASFMSYLYHELSPYEQVSICISANTTIGEGPKSVEATNRTQESGIMGVCEELFHNIPHFM